MMLVLAVVFSACHQDNDDYMTTVTITLDGGEQITIEQVQAMAHLTNLNSRHVTSTANFIGPKVQLELLRGAYQVQIEGALAYKDQDGVQHVRSFRAISDYVELIGSETSEVKLNIIFLD